MAIINELERLLDVISSLTKCGHTVTPIDSYYSNHTASGYKFKFQCIASSCHSMSTYSKSHCMLLYPAKFTFIIFGNYFFFVFQILTCLTTILRDDNILMVRLVLKTSKFLLRIYLHCSKLLKGAAGARDLYLKLLLILQGIKRLCQKTSESCTQCKLRALKCHGGSITGAAKYSAYVNKTHILRLQKFNFCIYT